MIDTSGHHLVYGTLVDYISGEELQDTDDERIRQALAKILVEELGYAKSELEPRLTIDSTFNNIYTRTTIELTIRIKGYRLFILRYGPGSLVTREKAAIAAARILEPEYQIPLAVITNGRDAELLDTREETVLATGMDCIPSREQAEQLLGKSQFLPISDPRQHEMALRILNVFDREICCVGSGCEDEDYGGIK